jgi:fatty-acyl-CoA synthase
MDRSAAMPAPACPDDFAAVVERAAALWPTTEAFVGDGARLTFAALRDRVTVVADALAGVGIRRGDHVGVCLGNTAEWVTLFLAIGALGATTVPVNTRLKTAEIEYTLHQSEVRCLFVADRMLGIDFIAMLREIAPGIDAALPDPALPELSRIVVLGSDVPAGCMSYDRFLAGAANPPAPLASRAARPEAIGIIQYTSGTTSFPKGVMLPQRNVLWDAHYVGQAMGLRPGDRHLSPRVFFHVSGSVLSVLVTMQHGVTLVTMSRFDGEQALLLAEAERCTHLSGNDTMFLMMLNAPGHASRRLIARGGMIACTPVVAERVIEELGAGEVVTGYGLSEASPNVWMAQWSDPVADRVQNFAHPHPGLEVRIVDAETGAACPPGQPGEIRVRGWSIMAGYYNKPEETRAALGDDGELRTGDLGVMRPDGKCRFLGRIKDIIRVGGENVAPADIESVLHRHPAVKQAQVVGVPDARLMEVAAAFIVPRAGCAPTPEEIIAWCRPRMANFKVPRYVRIVDGFDQIGMTASAKIQKNKLAAYAREVFGLEAAAR